MASFSFSSQFTSFLGNLVQVSLYLRKEKRREEKTDLCFMTAQQFVQKALKGPKNSIRPSQSRFICRRVTTCL